MTGDPVCISVVMPVFNGEKYIASAIASCLRQLSGHDELIVVDNASTDATAHIVTSLPDPRIKYHVEPKQGVSAARNAGLRHVRGRYIAFLDSDDLWPGGRHQALTRLLDDHPEIDAAYGRIRLQFDRSDTQRLARMDGALTPSILLSPFLFRRTILDRIGDMDETLHIGEDADYLARLQEAGMRLRPWDGDAIIYRQHDSNMTLMHEQFRSGQFGVLARKIRRNRIGPT